MYHEVPKYEPPDKQPIDLLVCSRKEKVLEKKETPPKLSMTSLLIDDEPVN